MTTQAQYPSLTSDILPLGAELDDSGQHAEHCKKGSCIGTHLRALTRLPLFKRSQSGSTQPCAFIFHLLGPAAHLAICDRMTI
jgi:hypothetical protein